MSDRVKGSIAGTILALATVAIASFLPKPEEIEIFAVLLAGIAAVYLGFAFSNGGGKEIVIELINIMFYLLFIFAGLWIDPLFLIAGYFWHGIWDVLHSKESQIVKTKVPECYIYFCMAYDWIIGIFIFMQFI